MLLVSLVEDVLLQVLSFCTISSALAFSQSCKRLRVLVFDKQVWLALIGDLNARSMIDLPPGRGLRDLTTLQLIDLAKRAVHGPRTWSHLYPSRPVIARQYILHPTISLGPGILDWENEVKLLPGGRYVLFNNWRRLECWNVAEDRLVWQHHSTWEHASVVVFAAEVVENHQATVIMIGQRIYGTERKNIVEIVHLDFLAGVSRPLMLTRAPDSVFDNPFFHPRICNGIAAVGVNNSLFLMNWKISGCLVLSLSSNTQRDRYDVALTRESVVTVHIRQTLVCQLIVWPNDSFAEYWSPNDDREHWKTISAHGGLLAAALSETINLHSDSIDGIRLSVHDSPLYDNIYIIWVCTSLVDSVRSVTHASITCKYHLLVSSPPGLEPNQLHQKLCMTEIETYPVFRYITYSGHTETFDYAHTRTNRVWALWRTSGRVDADVVELPDGGDHVHISAYSGALAYSTSQEIVVNYYE